jgi:hypothetical protein
VKCDLPGVGFPFEFTLTRNELLVKAADNGMYLLIGRGMENLRSAPAIRPLHRLVSLAFVLLLVLIKLSVLHHSIFPAMGMLLFLDIDLRGHQRFERAVHNLQS